MSDPDVNEPVPSALSDALPSALPDALPTSALPEIAERVREVLLPYKFGLDQMLTKINILREELQHRGQGNPIEHVSSRIKSMESIRAKVHRIGCGFDEDAIAENLHDIAGVRIVCSFIPDTYQVLQMLVGQADVTVVAVKDYIEVPKPNGYRSLHAVLEIPVFLSSEVRRVRVELQIRTVAMDFWAAVEHKIHYKYAGTVPDDLRYELSDAARVASDLDQRMTELRRQLTPPESR